MPPPRFPKALLVRGRALPAQGRQPEHRWWGLPGVRARLQLLQHQTRFPQTTPQHSQHFQVPTTPHLVASTVPPVCFSSLIWHRSKRCLRRAFIPRGSAAPAAPRRRDPDLLRADGPHSQHTPKPQKNEMQKVVLLQE